MANAILQGGVIYQHPNGGGGRVNAAGQQIVVFGPQAKEPHRML